MNQTQGPRWAAAAAPRTPGRRPARRGAATQRLRRPRKGGAEPGGRVGRARDRHRAADGAVQAVHQPGAAEGFQG